MANGPIFEWAPGIPILNDDEDEDDLLHAMANIVYDDNANSNDDSNYHPDGDDDEDKNSEDGDNCDGDKDPDPAPPTITVMLQTTRHLTHHREPMMIPVSSLKLRSISWTNARAVQTPERGLTGLK
jgi:hypothetical protein